ncbi:hypothetical protein GCM10023264_21160 [Sphingomonas daechungensis]|uniref:Aspartyl protease family protein n=1 Tax=Sphingomonas daechungensis TaxID=1176646 RepID=A0ABX6T1Y6_9SPHN|nr:aspartyl protease family protein [Sphingomonas daechungensis]QNP43780.1 aspartyl protease family protein [Sphingomonas daechungensis]
MKRQTRIVLGLIGMGTGAALAPHLAAAQIAAPAVSTVPNVSPDIPFDLFRGSRIVLTGRVNGVDTPMMLDSGAGVTTLDDDFAKKIGLKSGSKVTALGTGGSEQGELVRDVTIQAGNLKLTGVTVLVLDLQRIEKAIGRPIPAVLGHEVFVNSVIGLDFDRQVLTLSPSTGFAAPSGATEVKLSKEGTLHYLPISIAGLRPIEAALDLGNGGALSVSKEYFEANPSLAKLPYALGLGGGVGGLHEDRRATIPTVSFAGFTLPNVPADFRSVGNGPYAGRANAGILLFKPFHLTLDLGHDRMWLKRSDTPLDFPKDRVGMFVLLEDDHFNVLHVSPGSPADKAGLRKGDKLVEVDGERVGPGFYASRVANWAKEPVGTKVAVTKADGQTVTVTLANYY